MAKQQQAHMSQESCTEPTKKIECPCRFSFGNIVMTFTSFIYILLSKGSFWIILGETVSELDF